MRAGRCLGKCTSALLSCALSVVGISFIVGKLITRTIYMKKLLPLIAISLCVAPAAYAEDGGLHFHPFRFAKHFMVAEGAGVAGHALLSHETMKASLNDKMLRTPGLAKIRSSIQDDTYLASGSVALAALSPHTAEGRQADHVLRTVLSRHPEDGVEILANVIAEFGASNDDYRSQAESLAQSLNIPFSVYSRAMATADEQVIRQREHQRLLAAKLANGDLISESEDPDCTTKGVNLDGSYASTNEDVPALASDRRNKTSGYASGGENLPYISTGTRWFYDVGDFSYAPIPKQVADALRGRKFNNFDGFRQAIWKTISRNPTLIAAGNFQANDESNMARGNAPKRKTNIPYNIHHIVPIHAFGQVYGFDNLLIVKASCHRKIHKAIRP